MYGEGFNLQEIPGPSFTLTSTENPSSTNEASSEFESADWVSEIGRERVRLEKLAIADNPGCATSFAAAGASGHSFQHSKVKDGARAHFGNVYKTSTHHHIARAESELTAPDLKQRLKFGDMNDREFSISPAYADTCKWIIDRPEYIRWREPSQRTSHNGVLWIKGKAGCGKSTLTKFLLNFAEKQYKPDMIISFFFNSRSPNRLLKSTEGMYRSLLHQVFDKAARLEKAVPAKSRNRHPSSWPIELLEDVFRGAILGLEQNERLLCYIDALDECDIDEVRRAIGHFEDLAESAGYKGIQFWLCLASRYYPNITMQRHEEVRLDLLVEHMDDISRYVKSKLAITGRLKEEFREEIQQRCSGVFLWVVLVVKLLNEKDDAGSSPSQLRAILKDVPNQLQKLFAGIMEGADDTFVAAMQWMLFAREVLTPREYYFAIRSTAGDLETTFSDCQEIEDERMKRFIIHTSRGLVEVVYSAKPKIQYIHGSMRGHLLSTWEIVPHPMPKVQFIHESVREHLLSGGLASIDLTLQTAMPAKCHANISKGCQEYIRLCLSKHYALSSDPAHLGQRDVQKRYVRLLNYALTHAFSHLEMAFKGGALDVALLMAFPLEAFVILCHETKNLNIQYSATVLYLLIEHACIKLAEAWIQYACRQTSDVLRDSALPGQIPFARLDLRSLCGGKFGCPLQVAVYYGQTRIVKQLLDHGADANLIGGRFYSALGAAVHQNNVHMARILLRRGADINLDGANVLHTAAKHGHSKMLLFLLRQGVSVNTKDGVGKTALYRVATGLLRVHSYEIMRMLVKYGANVNASDDSGATALITAAMQDEAVAVRFLLENGATVDAKDKRSRTALMARAENPFQDGIETTSALLECGADINAVGGTYDSALIAACFHGKLEGARHLIRNGANLKHRSENYGTAIEAARAQNRVKIVELLERAVAHEPDDITAVSCTSE